jgi:hypothetical protein
MNGGGTQRKCRFKSNTEFQIGPGGCLQVKSLIAPAHGQVLYFAGIFQMGMGKPDFFAPVYLFRFYRYYQVGMHSIGLDVNGHFFCLACFTIHCNSRQAPGREQVYQHKKNKAKDAPGGIFKKFFQG